MYVILHTIIFAYTCDFVWAFYVPCLPLPPYRSSLLLPPEDWVGGEESAPHHSGYSGNAAQGCQVQKGEGLAWGRGDRALLREGKEDRRL